jgi:hypothetical protein
LLNSSAVIGNRPIARTIAANAMRRYPCVLSLVLTLLPKEVLAILLI